MVLVGGLLIAAFAAIQATASPSPQADSPPHNRNNPHRSLLHRSITNSAASVSGRSFDFVIAGGGVAGLALAARLSEWSNVTVLCIEAGGDGDDVADQIDIPGYSYLKSLGGSAYDWQYKTTPQVDALGTTKDWPRGKGLGGSGAINGLYWGRGDKKEYDAWATLNPDGAQTWNWAEMAKYINKAENFTAPPTAQQREFGMVWDASAHGRSGPIQATTSQYIFDGVKNWIPAWINLGFQSKDLAAGSTNGVTISTSTINPTNQSRSDSKAGYIDPLPPRANLVILTGQQVTQVIFNGSTDASGNIVASGVRFQANAGTQSYSVQANKEVILAGGTVGSPQILQLSGIGPKSVLQPLGISSKLDLPVGYNLQDHVSYSMYWTTPRGTLTWSNLSASATLQAEQLTQWRTSGTGMWTYINEAVGYPSMTDMLGTSSGATYASTVQSALPATVSQVTSWLNLPSDVSSGLAAQFAIQQQWLAQDVGQLEIILHMLGNGGGTVGIQVALQHAWSRGTIFVTSTDPFTSPAINPDYFGVGYDIDIMNAGSEFARKLAATAPLSDLLITETSPGAAMTDYDALANFTKRAAGTEYHPLGTCAMLPRSSGGVVDTNLVVYGTANLRVIDASIMPLHLSAHLMASTYGVAEKGADIVKAKYMYQPPSSTNTSASGAGGAAGQQTGTASAGVANDPAVTGANNLAGASSGSPLSSGAKIGVGVGVALGALALIGALIVFFCLRRRKNKSTGAGVAATGGQGGRYNDDPAFASGNGRGAGGAAGGYSDDVGVPMRDLAAPTVPYAGAGAGAAAAAAGSHQRKASHAPSLDSVATAEMASRMPLTNRDSGYGLAAGLGDDSRPATPGELGYHGSNHFGYPASPPRGAASTWGQQKYTPVNIS